MYPKASPTVSEPFFSGQTYLSTSNNDSATATIQSFVMNATTYEYGNVNILAKYTVINNNNGKK